MSWQTFKQAQPTLGMDVIVDTLDGVKHNIGKITMISKNGNWFILNTEKHLGVSVRPEYQWQEVHFDT